jgi:hypothetical protein
MDDLSADIDALSTGGDDVPLGSIQNCCRESGLRPTLSRLCKKANVQEKISTDGRHTMISLLRRTRVGPGIAALSVAFAMAHTAAAEELTVYTAIEAEDLGKYA